VTQTRSDIGLGASEIAAVAGLNPHASPWDVWLAKTGQARFEGNELTEWGHRIEPAIRQKYADATGYIVEVPASSMFHSSRPWQRATPDGIVYTTDAFDLIEGRTIDRLFQAKNVGEWPARRLWEAGVPDYVQLQEQWEMDVTGAPVADVCALIGGNEFRRYAVHRDAKIAADLVEIGAEFMRRVERGMPPDVDHSDACKDHLVARMNKARAVEFRADAETESFILEWQRLHVEAKEIERKLDAARNAVRRVFAEAQCERVTWSGGVLRIQAPRTATTVDYETIARLVASAKGMTAEEFRALVAEHSDTKTIGAVLAAPANWRGSE
jgi:putative phage-type endonuclease